MDIGTLNHTKYWLKDHDTAIQYKAPPVTNTWYTLLSAKNVRLLWNTIIQANNEAANKNLEVIWIIDGNSYSAGVIDAVSGTLYSIYRIHIESPDGLTYNTTSLNAANFVDKRGLDFLIKIRLTSAAGTAQTLTGRAVYETLEETS